MSRRVITEEIWVKIQTPIQFYGCYRSRNSKNIMEAILWKLRTGTPWRDIPNFFVLGKQPTIVERVKGYERRFLTTR